MIRLNLSLILFSTTIKKKKERKSIRGVRKIMLFSEVAIKVI